MPVFILRCACGQEVQRFQMVPNPICEECRKRRINERQKRKRRQRSDAAEAEAHNSQVRNRRRARRWHHFVSVAEAKVAEAKKEARRMRLETLIKTKHIWMAKKEAEPELEVVWDGSMRKDLLPERTTKPSELWTPEGKPEPGRKSAYNIEEDEQEWLLEAAEPTAEELNEIEEPDNGKQI